MNLHVQRYSTSSALDWLDESNVCNNVSNILLIIGSGNDVFLSGSELMCTYH